MELNTEEEQEEYTLTDTEIFTKIWIQPRLVFRYINYHSYDKFVPYLVILAGIYRAFDNAMEKHSGENFSLFSVLFLAIIFGGLLGWISYYIYAALISFTGKWIGGIVNTRAIFNMMAHGMTPSIIALFLFSIQIIIHGNNVFMIGYDTILEDFEENSISVILIILQLIFTIYTVFLCVIGLSEIQNFSIWKSILNFLLPILMIVVPVVLILLFFGDINSL